MSTASLKLGTLLVRVERGRELGGAGKSSSILSSKSRLDPFVAVSLTSSDEQRTTPAIGGGKFPSWEHCPPLKFHLDANARSSLHIDVYDQRTMGGDKKLGRAIVNFAPLLSGTKSEIHEWFPLMSEKSGESKGEVRVKIVFEHEQRKHDTVVINFGSQPQIAAQTHSVAPVQALQQQPFSGMSPPQQYHQQPIMYYHPTGAQQPLSPVGQVHSIQPQSHTVYPPTPPQVPPQFQQQQQPVQYLIPANSSGYTQLQHHHYPPNVILPAGAVAPVPMAMVPQQQQPHQVFASSAPYPPMMTTMPISPHPQQQQQPLDPNLYPPPQPPILQPSQQYGTLNQQQAYQVYPFPPQQQPQATTGTYSGQAQSQHQHGFYSQ
ncbi:hypothetical protein BCR44DRAFT_1447847 [Catenaria anguillulae PL171]|uniref:C2 domain-containing protein n=1 Tax=Catenaria anguillulae PL171 TaxID=765915 RepID=A0A1Y2H9R0_9FUNG|nr:hypothetical protein BCR44DRAFT_1447847 [Catenaria anguillulae PL171]